MKRKNKSAGYVLLLTAIFLLTEPALSTSANIEAYGLLPKYRSFAISPDGKHYAAIQRDDNGDDYFTVIDASTHRVESAIESNSIKARSVFFATNNHLVLHASDIDRKSAYRSFEHSGSVVYNLRTKKLRLLLKGIKSILPAQTGMGKIVGLNEEQEAAYMPAYANADSLLKRAPEYPLHLYRVNINTGLGKIHAMGRPSTLDWFVDSDGAVLAKEEYVEAKQEHRVYSKTSGKWKLIYSLKTLVPEISIQAVSSDASKLLYIDDLKAVYSMRLSDGQTEGPLYFEEGYDIDYLEVDINRKFVAVKYGGFKTRYQFEDEHRTELFQHLNAEYPMSSVSYESSTADNSKIIIKVSGAEGAGGYKLFDTEKLRLTSLATEYPSVDQIGEIKAIRYTARDNLKIPAIVTFPVDKTKRENLPLIVLPHGGPESYNRIEFNWLAQYLANKGYMVLQPNFRGSMGFGYEFRDAGRGKWGREMQDDISDGVRALVDAGDVDPKRVCIMGASFGGYSALVGGAFSPELYRCVIAINGLSDIPLMLKNYKKKYGSYHWVINYWEKVIGDSKTGAEEMKNISPINFAEKFQAPVLLIHGKDDTIVPIRQSRAMNKALKKAKKDVKLITLKGQDHWLSDSPGRLAALKAVDGFLDQYNPAD